MFAKLSARKHIFCPVFNREIGLQAKKFSDMLAWVIVHLENPDELCRDEGFDSVRKATFFLFMVGRGYPLPTRMADSECERPLSFPTWSGKSRAQYVAIATNSLREVISGFGEDLTGTKLRSFQSPVLVNFRIAGSRGNPPYLSIPRGNSRLRSAEPSSTIGENRSEKAKRQPHTEYFGTIL